MAFIKRPLGGTFMSDMKEHKEQAPVVALIVDKKALAKKRDAYTLHCALICHQDAVAKSQAAFRAYLEGESGLANRLTPKE